MSEADKNGNKTVTYVMKLPNKEALYTGWPKKLHISICLMLN